ncbi:hypothetical protein GDO86_012260 [Hymenochirus boettgeri]|uniref:Uncharacterized protein n=1 Tax=Hymenochirus boettgeri TaxID=247094 RepID=A0A8T2IS94_9PIPI|nr:hypothetical protein GDO86_012260 [Hymenochirus boettgeri]
MYYHYLFLFALVAQGWTQQPNPNADNSGIRKPDATGKPPADVKDQSRPTPPVGSPKLPPPRDSPPPTPKRPELQRHKRDARPKSPPPSRVPHTENHLDHIDSAEESHPTRPAKDSSPPKDPHQGENHHGPGNKKP